MRLHAGRDANQRRTVRSRDAPAVTPPPDFFECLASAAAWLQVAVWLAGAAFWVWLIGSLLGALGRFAG